MFKVHLRKSLFVTIVAIVVLLTAVFAIATVRPEKTNASALDEIYYCDDGAASTETETFYYSTKTVTEDCINNYFPSYYNTNDLLTNTCANVAGANLIGFYDRYYTSLIPDYTPGILRQTGYMYYGMNINAQKKQDVIDDLYVRMSTNNPAPGTTQTQYETGLSSYVTSKNLSISYTSVMTSAALDMTKVATAISNGTPISLFLTGYNFSTMSDSGTSVTLTKDLYTGNHIAIVYGYQIVNYYDGNGVLVTTKTYLSAATGKSGTLGIYILNNNGTINDAKAALIS